MEKFWSWNQIHNGYILYVGSWWYYFLSSVRPIIEVSISKLRIKNDNRIFRLHPSIFKCILLTCALNPKFLLSCLWLVFGQSYYQIYIVYTNKLCYISFRYLWEYESCHWSLSACHLAALWSLLVTTHKVQLTFWCQWYSKHGSHTRSDKVRELATVCLPWQQWTETSVWFDDVGISAFHSCVVDLWQSLSECVLVCHARMSEIELEQRTNIKFLVKLGKSGSEIREMLVQVYGDNAMKKTAICKWVTRFSEGRGSVTDERSGQPAMSTFTTMNSRTLIVRPCIQSRNSSYNLCCLVD
jgi:hypothetical protein